MFWPTLILSAVFYASLYFIGLHKRDNVNMVSIIHASICVAWTFFFFDFDDDIFESSIASNILIPHSMAYFMLDTCVTNSNMWRFHHIITIMTEVSAWFIARNCAAYALYYTEMGGVLYHISRVYKDSFMCRTMFLIMYVYSRYTLCVFSFTRYLIKDTNIYIHTEYFLYWMIFVFFMCVIFMNAYFTVMQIKSWVRMGKTLVRPVE